MDGTLQAYADMPVYTFHLDNKASYRDTLERGPLVPITRMMETFVQFRNDANTSAGNLSLGVDFQNYTPQPRKPLA